MSVLDTTRIGIAIQREYLDVAPQEQVAGVPFQEDKPDLRILVILTDRIGDALNSIYFLSNLRRLYPQAHVVYITRTFGDPRFGRNVIGQYAGETLFLEYLSEQRFKATRPDVIFDLNPIPDPCPYYPEQFAFRIGHHDRCDLTIPQPERNWKANDHLNLLRAIGKDVVLSYRPIELPGLNGRTTPQAPTRPYVALCFESTARARMMSETLMDDVVDYLLARTSWDMCILGNNLNENGYAWRGTSRRVRQYTGRLSLIRTMCVLSHARFALAVDTGLMHVASYLGRPVLAIFTCSYPGKNAPQGQKGVSLVLRVVADPPSDTLADRDWRQSGVERAYLRLEHIVEGLEQLATESETTVEQRFVADAPGQTGRTALPICVQGDRISTGSPWERFQAAWVQSDASGADFMETLAGIARDAPIAAKSAGWTGRVCAELAEADSFLETYMRVKDSLLRALRPAGMHPSVLALYGVAIGEARREVFRAVSRCAVLGEDLACLSRAARSAWRKLSVVAGFLGADADSSGVPSAATALPCRSDVAVVVVARDNPAHLRACVKSLARRTSRPFDLFVVDCGVLPPPRWVTQGPGRFKFIRTTPVGSRSFAAAWGLRVAWDCPYVVLISASACAVEADWLREMIDELDRDEDVGAVGIHCGDALDHEAEETAEHLKQYILRDAWWSSLGVVAPGSEEGRLARLCAEGEGCFNGLTGIVQLYRGRTLRQIGVPIVDDRVLKHVHWDSELSMRVLAKGRRLKHSEAAARKLRYFGEGFDSGLNGVSAYGRQVRRDASHMQQRGYDDIAGWLLAED